MPNDHVYPYADQAVLTTGPGYQTCAQCGMTIYLGPGEAMTFDHVGDDIVTLHLPCDPRPAPALGHPGAEK